MTRDSGDVVRYNARAWDHQVAAGNKWTRPVSPGVIARARQGDWSVLLTASKPAPRRWFPDLAGLRALCLAAGGGQQGPVLAAAGAEVTVYDNSPAQLAQDEFVADRDGLSLRTVQGDMQQLKALADSAFDLVFNPCSVCFIPDVSAVWKEVARVLAPGGLLLAGFIDPAVFIFDETRGKLGEVHVRHRLPYSDVTSLPASERRALEEAAEPFVWSHSLETLLGGQLAAGLRLTDLYEDRWSGQAWSGFLPGMLATRAVKDTVSD
jgi:SAM-dependent methyltransferase